MTTNKYKAFDPADYLDGMDDVARSQNMSELARRVGMSRDGLYKALSADGNPTWSTILRVTNALGLRLTLHSVACDAASRSRHMSGPASDCTTRCTAPGKPALTCRFTSV